MKRSFWSKLGPGLITGASDDDPAGIVTYAQAGAQFGFGTLWVALFTTPLMIAVQETCARIALVSRMGLFALLKRYLPSWLVWLLALTLIIANVFNIGADLNMMASSMRILVPLSRWTWLLIFAFGSLGLQIHLRYGAYERFLRWLVLSLLAYVGVLFFIQMPWKEAFLATVTPQFLLGKEYLLIVIAILGTTLSPYLFIWQSSEEVEVTGEYERAHPRRSPSQVRNALLTNVRFDVSLGMVASNVIFWCLVSAAAATLRTQGVTTITSPDQIIAVLRPFAGPTAAWLFVAGIIGTGLLTLPVLAGSAAYAVAEIKGWRRSLNDKYSDAKPFYGVIVLFTLLGLLLNVFDLPPIQMLIWSGVLNALLAPPLLATILWLANKRDVMKAHVNSRWMNFGVWLALFVMLTAAFAWGVMAYRG